MSSENKTATLPRYELAVRFLSNEQPWNAIHSIDHLAKTDESAAQCAERFREDMGDRYAIVLLKEGQQLEAINAG